MLMCRLCRALGAAACFTFLSFASHAADAPAQLPAYGPELEGFDYPYPVQQFRFTSQGVPLHMAYMDVKPAQPNGRTVVLLHGKNFCAATWKASIDALTGAGYRVVAS